MTREERIEGALRELLAWQPSTERGIAELHPQHRIALREAWAVLDGEIWEPAADTKEDA